MKVFKGILYLLAALFFTLVTYISTALIELSGDDGTFFVEEWLIGESWPWRLYAYLILTFLIFIFGLRKASFRFIVVRLLFVWCAYLFASMNGISALGLDGDWENYSLLDRLTTSPGSSFLYAYLILSLLFFHYSLRFAARLNWKWRMIAGLAACLAIYGLFWGTSCAMLHCFSTKHYEHHSDAEDNPVGERLQEQMSLILSSVANSAWPNVDDLESRADQEGLFDPNYYFTVFTNVSLEVGYELDFAYFRSWFQGDPWVYLKNPNTTSEPAEECGDWHLKVHLNGTPESYLEYAVLYLFADEFYLSGHAVKYSAGRIISSKAEFERLVNGRLRLAHRSMLKVCELDFFPRIRMEQDTVEVSIATFSPWRGLVRLRIDMEKEFPHQIIDWEWGATLIDCDCGIEF